MLGLRCCTGAFSTCRELGLLFIALCRLLTGGFSCRRAWALGHTGFSGHGSWALKHRFSSHGEKDLLLHHIWKLPLCSVHRNQTCVPYAGKWILIHCMPPGKSSLYILTPAEISPGFTSWPLGFGLSHSHLVITFGLITLDLMPHTVPLLHQLLLGSVLSSSLTPTDTSGPTLPHSLTPPRARPRPTHPTPCLATVSQHQHHKQIISTVFATKLLTIYYSCIFNWD